MDLTQNKLADILETTQRKISYWEQGKVEPDLYSLWKIADFFEVTVDYLLGRKDI
jgi:transcriptional regulator with XRE-family HTH domain